MKPLDEALKDSKSGHRAVSAARMLYLPEKGRAAKAEIVVTRRGATWCYAGTFVVIRKASAQEVDSIDKWKGF